MAEEQVPVSVWEKLERVVDRGEAEQLEALLESLAPGETARTIARMSESKRTRLLELLPADTAADLIEALSDTQAVELIEELPAERAAAIVDRMASDEQADLLGELDEEDAQAILERMTPEEARDVRQLSRYGSDTAGGIMITEYLSYSDDQRVDDMIQDLQQHADKYKSYDVQYVYVVQKDSGKLQGVVRVRDAVLSARSTLVTSVMKGSPHSIAVTAPLDDVEDFFDRHDLYGVPVVEADGRLVGVVRRAHMEEALGERADKALLRVGGIVVGDELRSMPLITRALRRLIFLFPNVGLNLIAASVIAVYEPTLAKVTSLMIFLPILSDMSGCSGNQAVAVSMRELSLGLVKPYEVMRVLSREVGVGAINGLILGLVLGLIAWGMRGNAYLGLVVAGALAVNSVVAVSIGGVVPLVLKGLKVDPALASGPILTTVTDLCGFLFALSLATVMLPVLTA